MVALGGGACSYERGTPVRKGDVLAYVGLFQNLKDLKDLSTRPSGKTPAGAPPEALE